MSQESFFTTVLAALERSGVPYMVAGSVAAMLYGEPRLTNDMDVVAEMEPGQADRLLAQFAGEDYYAPSGEFVRSAIRGGGSFNVIHVPTASKVDIILKRRTDFAAVEFARRRRMPFAGQFDAPVATPEDVIVSKLLFYVEGRSEKHLADIAGVLRVSASRLDTPYIDSWVTRLGLQDAWKAARAWADAGR